MAGADAAPTAGSDGEGLTDPPQDGSPGVGGVWETMGPHGGDGCPSPAPRF